MGKLGKAEAIALVMLLVCASSVEALVLDDIVGSWSNMVGAGATEEYRTVGDEVQALWGTPGSSGKSGLGFTPNQALPIVLDGEFEIGTLRHFNNTIQPPAATAVDLTTDLTFTDPDGSSTFPFTFSIEETENQEPCPYPSTTPCSDRIGFPGEMPFEEFDVNGGTYRLDIVGFKVSPTDPLLEEFISNEGGTNSALLYGEITLTRLEVDIDIKPGSCPNPLNLRNKGVLPVAVLGTEYLDVTTIDPSSITLTREGVEEYVAPLRWEYEDVGTPFEGELCDCHELNGDGYLDLTLKFRTQELVQNLGLEEVCGGETIPLTLEGNFDGEDAVPITGEDCVWLLKEICDNGIDDDHDGLIDELDADCVVPYGCATYPPVEGSVIPYFLPYLFIPLGIFVLFGIVRRRK
jgi:hypothetical protein